MAHDMCSNPSYKRQNQLSCFLKQFQLEGAGFGNKIQKLIEGTEKARDSFLKPALSVASLYIWMAVGAKTKNAKVGATTSVFSESISNGFIVNRYARERFEYQSNVTFNSKIVFFKRVIVINF